MREASRLSRGGRRVVLAGVVVVALAAVFASGLHQYLTLDWIKAQQAMLHAAYGRQPVAFISAFVALQAAALTLLVPGAVALFALTAGAVMGPWVGTPVVLVAVTLGDSLGFLVARHVARDWAARRFERPLARLGEGGAAYLLSLRLMAVVPYFVVNIAMALTRMPLRVFAPVSFVGLAPATFLHVNAGVQLSRIERVGDILTLPVLAAFTALALFPLAMRRLLRPSRRPERTSG